MPYANIGHVKIPNDGYIWGGFSNIMKILNQIEKHEALTNGPLKFGTVYPDGHALIDLAVVHEYQQALKSYEEATTDADKNAAAERMRNADSDEGKETRDNQELTWKILNYANTASVFSNIQFPIASIPVNPFTTGNNRTEDTSTSSDFCWAIFDLNDPKNLLQWKWKIYVDQFRMWWKSNGFKSLWVKTSFWW